MASGVMSQVSSMLMNCIDKNDLSHFGCIPPYPALGPEAIRSIFGASSFKLLQCSLNSTTPKSITPQMLKRSFGYLVQIAF